MKWEDQLSRWLGSQIEVHIEDQAGLDPVAPPRTMKLEKFRIIGRSGLYAAVYERASISGNTLKRRRTYAFNKLGAWHSSAVI